MGTFEMIKYKLGDLCNDVVDCPHSTPIWKNSGVRVIRNFNIKGGRLDFTDGYYVDEETYIARTKRAIPECEDLVISREAPMGAVCIIPKRLKCCLGQRLVLLKVNKKIADPKYLCYMIQGRFVQSQIERINLTGSIVSNLNIPDLKSLIIPLPSLPIQRKIAAVLTALDDKIALNKRINDKLEAMVKRLYDYWFVQFDFPDENGRPYKSSGGKMVWNETLKREIPEGWVVKRLGDIAKTYSGGTPTSTKELYYKGGTIPWINSGELNNKIIICAEHYITEQGLNNSSAKYYPQNAILVAMYGATAGKVSYLTFPATSNQAVCGIIPNSLYLDKYLLFAISSMTNHYFNISSGSARDNISQEIIKQTNIAIPNISTLESFNINMNKLYSKLILNTREVASLTSLRDHLLPLLMNGQVEAGGSIS